MSRLETCSSVTACPLCSAWYSNPPSFTASDAQRAKVSPSPQCLLPSSLFSKLYIVLGPHQPTNLSVSLSPGLSLAFLEKAFGFDPPSSCVASTGVRRQHETIMVPKEKLSY